MNFSHGVNSNNLHFNIYITNLYTFFILPNLGDMCCVCGGGEQVTDEEFNRRQKLEKEILVNEENSIIQENQNLNFNVELKSEVDKIFGDIIGTTDLMVKQETLLKKSLLYDNEKINIDIKDSKVKIKLEYDDTKTNLLLENKQKIINEFQVLYYDYIKQKYEETNEEKYNIRKENIVVTIEKGSLIINMEIKTENNCKTELQTILDLLDNGGENIIQYGSQGNSGIMAPYININ